MATRVRRRPEEGQREGRPLLQAAACARTHRQDPAHQALAPERTRFEFSHNAPVTDAQVAKIEALVNAEILANAATQARVLPLEEAQKTGAMLFGEKHGEIVRALDIVSSRELCGGTHVQRTGDIGLFKIVADGGIAAGIRRVEAVTGGNALAYLQSLESTVAGVAGALKVTSSEVGGRVAAVLEQVRALERAVAALKGKLASARAMTCSRRRWTWVASRCSRPCCRAPMRRPCARRWTR